MALSELLFVADLLTKDAEAKDASKYRPAQVVDMAAECTPEPASVGSSVFSQPWMQIKEPSTVL